MRGVVDNSRGYTIVETLIFLAVSSLMFFAAMLIISGQQNKAQFTSGVRDFETRLNDVANDVATGFYTNPGGFRCQVDGSGNPQFIVGTTEQGANGDCIFAGRVMKLGTGSGSGNESYDLMTMVGARTSATTLAASRPRVLTSSGAIQSSSLTYGMTVECIALGDSCDPGVRSAAAIGFFTRFNENIAKGTGIQTDVIVYDNVLIEDNRGTATSKVNSKNSASDPGTDYSSVAMNPKEGVTICVKSGATQQYALIHLGGNSSGNMTITSEIKEINGAPSLCS